MTDSEKRQAEFKKWWSHTQVKLMCGESLAQQIWNNAWSCAKLGQYESAKSEALATIKSQLLREATSSFLDGDDDEARTLRSLANRIATLEEK